MYIFLKQNILNKNETNCTHFLNTFSHPRCF
jgi:hypothetical protein